MTKISYQEYLNQINTCLDQMNESQLRQLLFAIAKRQPEENRNKFLENFKLKKHKPFDEKEYQKYLRYIKKLSCDDYMITREEDEEDYYDDWQDIEPEYIYSNTENVKTLLNQLFQYAKELFENEHYRQLNSFLLELSHVHIQVSDDINGIDEVNIKELMNDDILPDYFNTIRNNWIASIALSDSNHRAKDFTRLLEFYRELTVEMILMNVVDVDEKQILNELIDFFKDKYQLSYENHFIDACLLLGGSNQLLHICEEVGASHPILCLKCSQLLYDEKRYDELKSFGLSMVEKMDKYITQRSDLAKFLIQHQTELNFDEESFKQLIQANFLGSGNVEDFMPCIKYDISFEWLHQEIEQKLNHYPQETQENQKIDYLSDNYKYFLRFMDGRLMECWEERNISDTNKTAAFILLLNNHLQSTSANKALANCLLRTSYFASHTSMDPQEFIEIFNHWKQNISIDFDQSKMIQEISEQIESRADFVLSNKYRNGYSGIAMQIVAFAELLVANGMINFQGDYIDQYHKKYQRFSVFRKELRRFGG